MTFRVGQEVVCIDNWSEFGGPKDEFLTNFNTYKGENDAEFIENDCFKVDVSQLPKFNMYMYDGNHTYLPINREICMILSDIFTS